MGISMLRKPIFAYLSTVALAMIPGAPFVQAQSKQLERFQTQQLTDIYYSEGAGAGDLDNDGDVDIVYGPLWFEGPDFKQSHEIYAPKKQDTEKYADHFFAWVYDFDSDGWKDVFVVGFPGTPAYVYQNPGKAGAANHWKKHQVFDWVSNESPQLIQLVGDERPELVCTRDGFFGYATIAWDKPFEAWKFVAVSPQVTDKKFGHGLGIGDVNNDGRMDILHSKGWIEQPATLDETKPWRGHEANFTNAYGGAEMYAYDVDGDGDSDIITSQAAHDFGLSWYEQKKEEGEVRFVRHDILGKRAEDNPYGVVFSELHSVNLADMDGDGLKDIITGKTYYSHHKQSPMWDAGAVAYWFKLVRGPEGVQWIPFRAADDCGVGRQLGIHDINGDKIPDIVVGGMKGAHVVFHRREKVDDATWNAAQPQVVHAPKSNKPGHGQAFEGEQLKVAKVTGGTAKPQSMGGFAADRWSDDAQLWWTGGKPGDRLDLEFDVAKEGTYDLSIVLTKAQDYGIVQLYLDDAPIGKNIDLYNRPQVITTGMLSLGQHAIKAGKHQLGVQIQGSNPAAVQAFMVGIDLLQIGNAAGSLPKDATGKVLNLDFEKGTLEDWTVEKLAFADQPIKGDVVAARRNDMRSQHQGDYWIGGFEKKGDPAVGTLTSASFAVTHPFASYLMGGGSHADTRVEIVDKSSGKVIHQSFGRETENMRQVVIDLRKHQNAEIYIRIVDNVKGGWGHVNFDNFRFHETQPGPIASSDIQVTVDAYPHRGLKGPEAAAAMQLPEGFKVIAAANEPEVLQPIAMCLDDRGRVWIAEAYEYPIRAKGEQGRDRILIFEDRDGNGTLETRKVFAEGLNLVSGLEVGFGGVWVGAAPYLLFLPDANGDDVADGKPQILLDGWGYQDTHETLNAFIWGPDGWLYGCHGVFTHSKVGKPGCKEEERQPINAGVWRYHPTRHIFEVFSHGTSNPWGVDFNDRGQAFVTACVIPHLFHMIQGGRYDRQAGQHFNPYTYADIKTIADHRHYLGATPHSGNGKSDAAGGGHAHAGAMIYLGGAWPETYRDQLFMNNIHGQRLNIDILKANGSGYIGSHGPDFLLTGDQASQILNLRYGPDGQAWMIDWYDMQACHLNDPSKHDRSNGRIYKIVYGDAKASSVDLKKASDLELAEYTLHKNDWYVRHARRVLQERSVAGKIDAKALDRLRQIATTHEEETKRLRAAWALSCVDACNEDLVQKLLSDKSPYVRAWAIQLGNQASKAIASVSAQKLAELAAKDASPVVRLYVASAAQRLPAEQRWAILEGLVSHAEDAKDHNLPLMYWYAAEPLSEVDADRALALALKAGRSFPMIREWMMRKIGASNKQALAILVRGLGQADSSDLQLAFLEAIRTSLAGQRKADAPAEWNAVYEKLAKSNDAQVVLQTQALGVTFGNESALAILRKQAQNTSEAADKRKEALASLVGAKDNKLAPVLQSLVEDKDLRSAALAGLAQYTDPKTSSLIIGMYDRLSQADKRIALSTLSSRPEYAVAMLKAIESKKIASTDLSADLVRQLQFLNSDEVSKLLESTWGRARATPAEKTKLIEEYRALVESKKEAKPDLSLGRAVYAKTCQQCHQLFGTGGKVGPDLTGSNRANLDYLLSNIVDPSAVMAKEYQPTIILTDDGRVITGIVKAEDDKSVTILTADAQEVLPKDEISKRQLSEKSMMPEDQLKAFSPHEVRSLMAYLANDRQVPLKANATNTNLFFNGKDLAGWHGEEHLWKVENGEIVGKSNGLKENEFLISDMSAGDFRLKLEIKLIDNQGNSGIQFRSQPQEHGILGYQADVGPGWWGKLYEEEGRALLWDKSGESHVKKGEWNTYEIEAVGAKVRTWINGQLCVDLEDPKGAKQGIFALQLHSGGPTEVRFRNLQLEVK